MKNPAHPGDFVKSEIIEPLCLLVTAAVLIQEQSDNIKVVCRDLLNKATALLGGADCPVFDAFSSKADIQCQRFLSTSLFLRAQDLSVMNYEDRS